MRTRSFVRGLALHWTCALAAATASLAPQLAQASEPEAADSPINDPGNAVALRLHVEAGLLAQLSHRLQFGQDGSYTDVRKDLGQDNLFPFVRFSTDLDIGRARRHTVTLLYQPLNLRSELNTPRDLQFQQNMVPADTPIRVRYGFSFWRATYLYDFLPDDREVAIGGGIQIRNANIGVSANDGSFSVNSRDVGPVPLLKFRGRGTVAGRFWMGGEIDGFYAPIRYINGSNTDVEGAIVDANLRFGLAFKNGVDGYLNLRWLGGGAQGTSKDPEPFTDGFTRNWLHFLTVGVGVSLR